MIYKMKDDEWQLLIYCFNKYIGRLSPVARINVSNLISAMQSDKTIHTIGQVDVLLYLLAVIKKDEETDMQEFSQKQTKLETEKAITPDNDEILLLIENMRLFRQYNDLNIEENNTLQRHQGF